MTEQPDADPQPPDGPQTPTAPPRLTPEEVDALARDTVMGYVFISPDAEVIRQAFLVAALAGFPPDASAAWQRMDQASDRSVWTSAHGETPTFLSCRWLHVNDGRAFVDRVQHWEATIYPNGRPDPRKAHQ